LQERPPVHAADPHLITLAFAILFVFNLPFFAIIRKAFFDVKELSCSRRLQPAQQRRQRKKRKLKLADTLPITHNEQENSLSIRRGDRPVAPAFK
jgi:hypothetical protein